MFKVSKRHFLKEKEAEQLLKELSQKLRVDTEQLLGTKTRIEQTESQDVKIFIINEKPLLAKLDGTLLPTLKFEEHINGNLIFRARKEHLHIVYCIDKKR